MSTPSETDSESDLTLTITREFAATPVALYDAWTKEEIMGRWSAPRGFTIPESSGDLRPGGAWECVMRSPEGHEMRLGGVYQATIRGEHLAFTHAWREDRDAPDHSTLVDITFSPSEKGTLMTFRQGVFRSRESRDGHAAGWAECFDRLEEILAEPAPSA